MNIMNLMLFPIHMAFIMTHFSVNNDFLHVRGVRQINKQEKQ